MKLRHEHSITTGLAIAITNIHEEHYNTALEMVRQSERILIDDIRQHNIDFVENRKNELRAKISDMEEELIKLEGST